MSAHRQHLLFLTGQTLTGLLAFNLTVELVLSVLFGPLDIPPLAQFLIAALPSFGGTAGLIWSKWPEPP